MLYSQGLSSNLDPEMNPVPHTTTYLIKIYCPLSSMSGSSYRNLSSRFRLKF